MVFVGGLDPDYVLHAMSWAEMFILLDGVLLRHKDEWEMARLNSYILAKVNSDPKKRFPTIEKWMPFAWEKPKFKYQKSRNGKYETRLDKNGNPHWYEIDEQDGDNPFKKQTE